MGDGGRSPGLGLQGQGPNHRELLRSNGRGGERPGKRRALTRQVGAGKTNASEPLTRCRKFRDVAETGLLLAVRDEARGVPADGPSGDRHGDGVSPAQALVRNVGTSRLDAKGDLQVADPRGAEYRCEAKGRTGP